MMEYKRILFEIMQRGRLSNQIVLINVFIEVCKSSVDFENFRRSVRADVSKQAVESMDFRSPFFDKFYKSLSNISKFLFFIL